MIRLLVLGLGGEAQERGLGRGLRRFRGAGKGGERGGQ